MEFSSRNGRGPAPQSANQGTAGGMHPHHAPRKKHVDWAARTVRIELFIVLVGSALLLAAVSLFMAFGDGAIREHQRVNENQYQAVFLNGGVTSGSVSYSTYFGKVTKINDNYMVLRDVYYLTDQQSSQNNQTATPQLTKLGCQQLHSPEDEMIINRTQIAFWENIKDDGKVVEAIKQFKQQNPNGPDCSQQNQQPASNNDQNGEKATPSPSPTPPANQ